MRVIVKRGNVEFTCTNEAQLNSFLEDGYEVLKAGEPEQVASEEAVPEEVEPAPKKKKTK